jgi:hypothetical protein
MKRKRFIEEQIIAVLREHRAGTKIGDLAYPAACSRHKLDFSREICSRLSAAMPIVKVAEACATRKQHC